MKMAEIIAIEKMVQDEKEKLRKEFADNVKLGDVIKTDRDKYAFITYVGGRRIEYLPWDHDRNRFYTGSYANSAYALAGDVPVEIIGHIDIAGQFMDIIKGAQNAD